MHLYVLEPLSVTQFTFLRLVSCPTQNLIFHQIKKKHSRRMSCFFCTPNWMSSNERQALEPKGGRKNKRKNAITTVFCSQRLTGAPTFVRNKFCPKNLVRKNFCSKKLDRKYFCSKNFVRKTFVRKTYTGTHTFIRKDFFIIILRFVQRQEPTLRPLVTTPAL
jgi:hypothetical protein